MFYNSIFILRLSIYHIRNLMHCLVKKQRKKVTKKEQRINTNMKKKATKSKFYKTRGKILKEHLFSL